MLSEVFALKNTSIYEIFPNSEHLVTFMEFEYKRLHTPLHWHSNFEILYVINGNLTVVFKDKKIIGHDGDCIFINQYELHEIPPTNAHYICVVVPSTFFQFFDITQKCKIKNLTHDKVINDYILESYEIALKENNTEKSKSSRVSNRRFYNLSLEIYGYFYLMFAHAFTNYSEKIKFEESNHDILNICQNIIKYILEHYQEKITIDDLTKLSFINKQSLQKHFKSITGTSIKAYIMDVRIKKAYDLLMYSKKSITDIAFSCGFEDSNYFSRVIKKYLGMSPSKVRETHTSIEL